ncbi:ead/Ea22-like family protein [Pseudomonas putida]|uniref:ead/Ea22-like family protein n=1 Tax=Pseudomonas putida TaxID=303 RepID=UPI0015558746|nr:ead/Ea22-like family protein [Pseudomonas putida]
MDTNKMRELKELAEAAGSDEWYAAGDLRYCDDKTGETHGLHHDDSRFIAAASPATVLALLEEIERLESAKGDPIGSFDNHMEYMQENIRLKADNEALRKDAELMALGRAKLAGAMSRLRAKHNDWTDPEALPAAELVWCACGDGFPPNSYGAGFMDANNGVCWSCDAAKAVNHD